jgi:hypothetical protein
VTRFDTGSTIQRREILHGRPWLVVPMRVVADTGDLLALHVAEGTPLVFPPHPAGPHPWSFTDRWRDTDVLQLLRPGDAYSVWGFFRAGRRAGWYVNFQRPFVRRPGAVDTLDHGVDILVSADGTWSWKDLDDVAAQVASGRLTEPEAAEVWREAGRVAALLDGDPAGHWWAAWSGWRPPGA